MHTVVLVDDEPWVAIDAMNSINWGQFGFQVAAYVSNPGEALEQIKAIRPSLCIVDIRMPGMDGLELIEKCMQEDVGSRFVILSGYSDFEYARRAMRLGVKDYWLKPLDPAAVHELLIKIRRDLPADETAEGAHADAQFSKVLEYIRFYAGGKLQLEDVGQVFNFNKNYLCALFKKKAGMSFVQYLTRIRLENSCELLRTTVLTVEEIAQRSGLGDYVYFNKVFKKHMHLTPNAYRRQTRPTEKQP